MTRISSRTSESGSKHNVPNHFIFAGHSITD